MTDDDGDWELKDLSRFPWSRPKRAAHLRRGDYAQLAFELTNAAYAKRLDATG
jgi:hypothetical protein